MYFTVLLVKTYLDRPTMLLLVPVSPKCKMGTSRFEVAKGRFRYLFNGIMGILKHHPEAFLPISIRS